MNRCGTESGYQDHLREDGAACAPCKRAHADKRADYRRRRYLNHAPLSVDATGTRRRIQALAAIGWSLAEQSVRMGFEKSAAHAITGRKWVTVDTAAKVRALYDELSMFPGPNVRARNDAARRGWPSPLAWDEDEIDDPTATPAAPTPAAVLDEIAVQRAMRGTPTDLRPAERAEAVHRLTELGLSAHEIARRLHVAQRSVVRIRQAIAKAA